MSLLIGDWNCEQGYDEQLLIDLITCLLGGLRAAISETSSNLKIALRAE